MPNLDDLDIDVDITVASPEEYADNGPALLPPGTYEFQLEDWGVDTRGKTPAIVIKRARVRSGQPNENKTITFQNLYATKYMRKNKVGEDVEVSQLGDYVRSIDRTYALTTIPELGKFLNDAVDLKRPFKASVVWEGWDKDYFDAQAPLRGVSKGDYKSPAAKQLSKESTIKGRNAFPDGQPFAVNPISGNKVAARVKFGNFFPSTTE